MLRRATIIEQIASQTAINTATIDSMTDCYHIGYYHTYKKLIRTTVKPEITARLPDIIPAQYIRTIVINDMRSNTPSRVNASSNKPRTMFNISVKFNLYNILLSSHIKNLL